MLWSAQREDQYLSDFSVSVVRKSTNSRHRKPPLRGGTMRYRADITKQRRLRKARRKRATVLQCSGDLLCASRACKMQPSDAVGMRIASALADQHLQVAGETDEQPRTNCGNSGRPRFVSSLLEQLVSFLGCFHFIQVFIAFRCFWLSKSSIFLRGAPPRTPLGLRPRPHLERTCPTQSGVAPPQSA